MAVDQPQVDGGTIELTMNGVMTVFRQRLREALAERGIEDVAEGRWYPLEDFTAVLEMIGENAGPSTLRKLGVAVADDVDWRDRPDSPADALDGIAEVMRRYHRGSVGDYRLEEADDGRATVTCRGPYPCEFDKGILEGTAERFGASYARVDEVGDRCRDDRGTACSYEVRW